MGEGDKKSCNAVKLQGTLLPLSSINIDIKGRDLKNKGTRQGVESLVFKHVYMAGTTQMSF